MATDAKVTVATNDAGEYEANGLRSGNYKITVAAKGFGAVEISAA